MRATGRRPDARTWPELWDRAAAARNRLLLLGFDGVLAPFIESREQVRLELRTRELLRQIAEHEGTVLGIVSGRPIRELSDRCQDLRAHLVGEHGWEEHPIGGDLLRHEISQECLDLLREGWEETRRFAPAGRLERKRASVVLHTSGLAPAAAADLLLEARASWVRLLRHAELELREIQHGWELRARGRSAGTAVSSLLVEQGRGSFAVCVGDHVLDDDAFAAASRAGFSIQVGDREGWTRAQAWLPDPGAVVEFLEIWRRRACR